MLPGTLVETLSDLRIHNFNPGALIEATVPLNLYASADDVFADYVVPKGSIGIILETPDFLNLSYVKWFVNGQVGWSNAFQVYPVGEAS